MRPGCILDSILESSSREEGSDVLGSFRGNKKGPSVF